MVGGILEDGRAVEDGSKYRKAVDNAKKGVKIINEDGLFKVRGGDINNSMGCPEAS